VFFCRVLSYAIKPRIYIILRGGLGNQLHQIAAAVKYSEKSTHRIKIYPHIVDNDLNPSRRGFFREIDLSRVFNNSKIYEVNKWELISLRIILRYLPSITRHIEVNEEKFDSKIFFPVKVMRGWFQSFDFLPENLDVNALVEKSDLNSKSLTIHVRLTDFLLIDNHPLDAVYYTSAYKTVMKENLPDTVHCYSDDIPSASHLLKEIPNLCFPEKDELLPPNLLLAHLASSINLICSKSSLCWWAALIVSRNGGHVISPWVDSTHDSKWLRIAPQKLA
jgi:hypothetical protein